MRRLVLVLLVAAAGCGEENSAFSPETRDLVQKQVEERRAHIERKVREGALPPVARLLIAPDGAMNLDFTGGPTDDVVRTSADGSRGKKLQWHLDQNRRIDRTERTITEQELYAATTRSRSSPSPRPTPATTRCLRISTSSSCRAP